MDEDGQLVQHVHVLINRRDIFTLQNSLETELLQHDVINIFPAMRGG